MQPRGPRLKSVPCPACGRLFASRHGIACHQGRGCIGVQHAKLKRRRDWVENAEAGGDEEDDDEFRDHEGVVFTALDRRRLDFVYESVNLMLRLLLEMNSS